MQKIGKNGYVCAARKKGKQGRCGTDFKADLGSLKQVTKCPNMILKSLCGWNKGNLGLGRFKAKNRNSQEWKPSKMETCKNGNLHK